MKDLLKKIARVIKVNLHENARKLIEHVRLDKVVDVKEDSISSKLIISKEELIDGKYFYKLRYGTDSNGNYMYSLKTIKELDEYDVMKLASFKLKNQIEKLVDDISLKTYKSKCGDYLSILTFNIGSEEYRYDHRGKDKLESNIEVLYEAVKFLKKMK